MPGQAELGRGKKEGQAKQWFPMGKIGQKLNFDDIFSNAVGVER